MFLIVFSLYFWDVFNERVFQFFYRYFEQKNSALFTKEHKIIGLYFSVNTFEKLQRRYVKEFYFLEKFFQSLGVRYIIITDANLNLLSKDIDLLIVNDARFIPISTILKFMDYSEEGGKILFTYQSLMFNPKGQRYKSDLYRNFGIYDVEFDNRVFKSFTFKHFTKIMLSRKYSVVLYADKDSVLGLTDLGTPFLVGYKNFYFLAENTFCIENLLNPYIMEFNVYLLEMLLDFKIDIEKIKVFSKKIKDNLLEIVMPVEYIINNRKIVRYFYFSKVMNNLYSEMRKALNYSLNRKESFLRIGLNKVDYRRYNLVKKTEYGGRKFFLLLRWNSQQGLDEYLSFRFNKIVSINPLVIEVDLEDYICSVVLSEMPDSFHLEALKAQALAARTYALKNKNRHKFYDLCDRPHCQNFEGEKQETFKSFIASYSTCSEIITYKGELIDAVYHSTCGGITANSEDVWNISLPYLRKTKDYDKNIEEAYCKDSRLFKWKIEINRKQAQKILSKTVPYILKREFRGNLKDIKIFKNPSLRVDKMVIITDKETYLAYKEDAIYLFSEDLYFSLLPSGFIEDVVFMEDRIVFYGRGFGHGVGLCQFGANYLAKNKNYIQIIKHYYKGVEISVYK
ncbi:MAG: SpoIID/LytB domain-containing protein [bacterium]